MIFTTRFAPSPSGPLHLGHAYSAILAFNVAQKVGGRFLLRIDDLDQSRARAHWEQQIYDDLNWLGVTWSDPVHRQSEHKDYYDEGLERLRSQGLTYECHCNRRDIEAAASAPQEGVPKFGPDGRLYPGTCRDLRLPPSANTCTRLNMSLACTTALPAQFYETSTNLFGCHKLVAKDLISSVGDVVLKRRNMAAAFHLAVVLDDTLSDVTHVIRGADLFDATKIHVLLQSLLNLKSPVYHHHRLIRDDTGKRRAKRDDARALSTFRNDGASPGDIRAMVGL